jgi:DNA-binding cell septation regulator SpoVG
MNLKKLTLLIPALLILIVLSVKLFCDEIAITEVKKNKTDGRTIYEISVNDCILIREVEVLVLGDKKTIKYPQYISQKKQVYPQIIFLTRQSKDAVRKAVFGGETGKYPKQNTKFKITRFSKFKKESGLKALCAVTFNSAFEVECKIIDGKNGLWVSWPSRKNTQNGQWVQQIVVTDKQLRENIECELLSRYREMQQQPVPLKNPPGADKER